MLVLKRICSVFVLCALVCGCWRAPDSPPVSAPVRTQADAALQAKQISFVEAADMLRAALKVHKVPDIDCLRFIIEPADVPEGGTPEKAELWEIALLEIHDEKCGGDPAVWHIRDRFKVSSSGKIRIYEVVDGEYIVY